MNFLPKSVKNLKKCHTWKSGKLNNCEVEEVKIPFGDDFHLGGKFWGDKSKSPIICFHGGQENAGSFDRLIPLLPRTHSYLAVEYLGLGLSSPFPNGLQLSALNLIHHFKAIQNHFQIDKMSIIGHSFSSILALAYGAFYPHNINMIVSIDARQSQIFEPNDFSVEYLEFLKNFNVAEKRNQQRFKKSFTIEELSEMYSSATGGSISKEFVPLILKRSIVKSEDPGKFYFVLDNRFVPKCVSGLNFFQKPSEAMIKSWNFPHMMIESSIAFHGWKTYHEDTIEVMRENKKFELHKVEGTHHVHLNDPEKISKLISEFIVKNC